MADVGYVTAFTAGVSSIATPCVGVIIPAFLAHVVGLTVLSSGQDAHDAPERPSNPLLRLLRAMGRGRWVVYGTIAFLLGFILTFVLLGSALDPVSRWVADGKTAISRAGGAVVILYGLVVTGLVPLSFLRMEGKPRLLLSGKLFVSFVVGIAFAIGWTPCVNAELGTILTTALNPGTAGEGSRLLTVYSAGLMLPFALFGAFLAFDTTFLEARKRTRAVIAVVAGLILIALGAMVVTERFQELTGYLFNL
jgi:cytochrome c-type biogenesis protein